MSSSDSDDDYYGNVALKLNTLKSEYKNLDIVRNLKSVTKDEGTEVNRSISENEITLDDIIAKNCKTLGRGAKRKAISTPVSSLHSLRKTRSRKKIGATQNEAAVSLHSSISSIPIVNSPIAGQHRGRGRGRGRRNRGNTTPSPRMRQQTPQWPTSTVSNIPTISIGNTAEYPDMSDNQQLFAPKNNDVVIIDEPEIVDENEELSVKVCWQSDNIYKFKIRRFQKLTKIFQYFSKKDNVSKEKLLFMYNDKILKEDDSPDSIDYSIAKFIDGGMVSTSLKDLLESSKKVKKVKDSITLKFQTQNVKKPHEVVIKREDKMSLAMTLYAEHLEVPLSSLKFYFDGDLITGKSTATELELEGGECIDVKRVS